MSGTEGERSLHLAAMLREPERVAALLLRGADPSLPGTDGLTPLHYAAASGVVASVRLLLRAGADPNAWFPRNPSPCACALVVAALADRAECVQVLLLC